MSNDEYFYDSVPDGLSIAINAFDSSTECCNQDSWELLVRTFGPGVSGTDLKTAKETDFVRFAEAMKAYFELSYLPSPDDAKTLINYALTQWGG